MHQSGVPPPSPRLLKQAEHLGIWIHQRTNNTELPADFRVQVSTSLLQHSLDIADATTFLLQNRLPGPALALARPLIESYMRGIWVLRCAADDSEIEEFLEKAGHTEWSIRRIAEKLKTGAQDHYPWIMLALSELHALHDLTHAGSLHVFGLLTGAAVQPNYNRTQLDALLERGIEVRIRIACELLTVLNDLGSIEELNQLTSSFDRNPI